MLINLTSLKSMRFAVVVIFLFKFELRKKRRVNESVFVITVYLFSFNIVNIFLRSY